MKKLAFIGLFLLVGLGLFADTAYRDQCRQILYAVNPVEAIGKLDQNTFQSLRRFALGLPVEGQEPLNATDERLMFFLYGCESARRTRTADAFSLYLQEQKEMNEPYLKQLDRNAITIDGWIDLFRLNLLSS